MWIWLRFDWFDNNRIIRFRVLINTVLSAESDEVYEMRNKLKELENENTELKKELQEMNANGAPTLNRNSWTGKPFENQCNLSFMMFLTTTTIATYCSKGHPKLFS